MACIEKEHTALACAAASFPVLPVVSCEYCHFPMLGQHAKPAAPLKIPTVLFCFNFSVALYGHGNEIMAFT